MARRFLSQPPHLEPGVRPLGIGRDIGADGLLARFGLARLLLGCFRGQVSGFDGGPEGIVHGPELILEMIERDAFTADRLRSPVALSDVAKGLTRGLTAWRRMCDIAIVIAHTGEKLVGLAEYRRWIGRAELSQVFRTVEFEQRLLFLLAPRLLQAQGKFTLHLEILRQRQICPAAHVAIFTLCNNRTEEHVAPGRGVMASASSRGLPCARR